MKRTLSIFLFAFLSLAMMTFIFGNSAQCPEVSTEKSAVVVRTLAPERGTVGEMEEKEFHNLVRKLAHLTEFAALGLCLCGLSLSIWQKGLSRWLYPVLAAAMVAAADETIQLFTGRTASLKDVGLDFFGAVCAIGLVALGSFLIKRMRRKKREQA